jgi:hypothetical protein
MKSLFIVPLVLFGLSTPSFAEDTNIRVLETKVLGKDMLVNRLCIGGYEFAVLCLDNKETCHMNGTFNYQMTQMITEDGGGKKC